MIPPELLIYKQWCNWRYEPTANGKITKVPYNGATGQKVSVSDPTTWTDYTTASKAMETGYYSGTGFVLSKDDPYTFIDLDNPDGDASILARHQTLLKMLDSYAEISPSGKGVHVIVRGNIGDGRKRDKVEIYSSLRYMTMTGNTFVDKPITNRQQILDGLYNEMGSSTAVYTVKDSPQTISDADVWAKMQSAANSDKIMRTWNADYEGLYFSQSECDQALINFLQFYTHNAEQIKRMFLASPCAHRLVTGEKHKYAKYIPNMIQKSFDRELPEIDFTAIKQMTDFKPSKLTIDKLAPAPPKSEIALPPGLLGEIAYYIYEQAPLPVTEVAMAGALALMAGIIGRSYNVSKTGLNVYLLVIAGTGIGKEAASAGISKLMSAVQKLTPIANNFQGPAEIASGPAISKYLLRHPCCYSVLGEFGLRLHEMCQERAQGHMVSLRRILLDLYHKSGRGQQIQPHIYSDKDKNTDVLLQPSYTILGESTPSTFYGNLDESMIADGLLPRFTVFEYQGKRQYLSDTFLDIEPSTQLVRRVAQLCSYAVAMEQQVRTVDLIMTPQANAVQRELGRNYTDLINQSEDNDIAKQLYNRAHLKIMKLAGLVAVGLDDKQPTVTFDHLEWARKIVDRDHANILHRFQLGKVGRQTGDIHQFAEMVRVVKEYIHNPFDDTMLNYGATVKMHLQRVIPAAYLQKRCSVLQAFRNDRMGSTFSLKRTIESMIFDGTFVEVRQAVMLSEFRTTGKGYLIANPDTFV